MKVRIHRRSLEQPWPEDAFQTATDPGTLAILFGAPELAEQPEALDRVLAHYGQAQCVGCSTAGEIFRTEASDASVVLAEIHFEHTRVRTASVDVQSASGSRAAGKALAEALVEPDLRGILVLSDGLNVNGSDLIAGIDSALPEGVVVTGGLAGDGIRFQKTWVLAHGVMRDHAVTAAGFYGDRVRLGHGSMGGWDIFGPERRITRSKGNVLYELDGKAALPLYKNYLGELASGLPASGLLFPLSIRSGGDGQAPVVRTILSVSEEEQSLTFAGDLPEGWYAQLMSANFDRLIEGASQASHQCSLDAKGRAALSIAISCVGRRLVLGERCEEELEATVDVLGPSASQIGFYSYGELSPNASGHCDLHNQTMTLTTITEV